MKKLGLSEYAQIAEILGAFAIVVSLIFVGLEIRQNTNQSKAESFQTSNTFFQYIGNLQVNEDTAPLLVDALNNFENLNQIQKVRFDGIMANISNGYVRAREYYLQGLLDPSQFVDYERLMAQILLSPGAQQYWSITKAWYPPYLQAEWDELIVKYSGDISFADMMKGLNINTQ